MNLKKSISSLICLALSSSGLAQASPAYLDTFQLAAIDSGSINNNPPSYLESITGTLTYNVLTTELSSASFTQIDNTNNGKTFYYDLSNNNASQISFIAAQTGFSLNANYDTAGDVNPGFGILTIAINQQLIGPLVVGTAYALQSGSIYDYSGVSYNLSGSLTLIKQTTATIPEPGQLSILLLGLPLIHWRKRRML